MTIGVFSNYDIFFPYPSHFQHLSFNFSFQLLNFNFLLLSEGGRTAETLVWCIKQLFASEREETRSIVRMKESQTWY